MSKFLPMLRHLTIDKKHKFGRSDTFLTVWPFSSECAETYFELDAMSDPDAVFIAMIQVGKGLRTRKYGETMLTQICSAANLFDVPLKLIARSSENRTDDLIRWYLRHGFQLRPLGPTQVMLRP